MFCFKGCFLNSIKEINGLRKEINMSLIKVINRLQKEMKRPLIKVMNRLRKEIKKLLSKGMSNIYLKVTKIKWRSQNLVKIGKNCDQVSFWRAPTHADIIEF